VEAVVKGAAAAVAGVVGAPVLLIVLLGAALSAAPNTAGGDSAPVAATTPAADRVRGEGGCTVADPSGTGGCVTPALAGVMAQVAQRFGHLPVTCWSGRGGDPYSDHPKGRACDYTIGRLGTYPQSAEVQFGWALASWLRADNVVLHVNYVIWQGRIWSRAHDADGWRLYTGGGHYAYTGPTNGHYDHVHVSTVD
jgi:hypothetical protein